MDVDASLHPDIISIVIVVRRGFSLQKPHVVAYRAFHHFGFRIGRAFDEARARRRACGIGEHGLGVSLGMQGAREVRVDAIDKVRPPCRELARGKEVAVAGNCWHALSGAAIDIRDLIVSADVSSVT